MVVTGRIVRIPTIGDYTIFFNSLFFCPVQWGTTVETQQPQPQRTQPANGQVQAAATPEIIHALGALEAALARGGDAHDIHTAFAALSEAERQAQWHTQDPLSHADQMAVWEQGMEGLLAPYRTDPALSDGLALLRRTLRQTPHQPLDTVEVSAHALYRTFIEEGNGDVVRFAQQIANTNTREEITANQDLIVQLAHMFGQQTATCRPALHLPPQSRAGRASSVPRCLAPTWKPAKRWSSANWKRQQGLYCIGVNGTGKTTLLANLIKKDLELGSWPVSH